MSFISVKEAGEKWGITERVVRQYCADGRVPGAFITGKTWNIPDAAVKPERKPRQRQIPEDLLGRLAFEKENGSIICREILKNPPSDPTPTARTEEFYATRPCTRMVMLATDILERYIQENPPIAR